MENLRVRRWIGGAAALAVAVLVAGCGSTAAPSGSVAPSSAPGGGAPVAVLATTNVWGDVAGQVGGSHVQVTSLMSDPSADPHSFQASAQNQLAVSKAALVIENGGGYDDFIQQMMKSAGTGAPVITAFELSKAATGDEPNEHVWYDLPTVDAVATAVATQLSAIDPAHAADYAGNAKAFTEKVAGLQAKEAAIKAKSAGVPVMITEPVPVYVLQAAGLTDRTPPEFSEAIEAETDVPAAILDQTLKLISGNQVKALVYNSQTSGPQTEKVLAAAEQAGIAVVPVTETLPPGTDFVTWMGGQLDALAAAVAS